MPAANDIKARADELQDLIADDRVSDALVRLLDFVRDFSDDREDVQEAVLICSSYKRLEKLERRGELPFEECDRHRTRMLRQMLQLIDATAERPKLLRAS
jgi:hypothetical protein